MTTEERLKRLESLCNRVYEEGKPILDPKLSPRQRLISGLNASAAFMGGYSAYLDTVNGTSILSNKTEK